MSLADFDLLKAALPDVSKQVIEVQLPSPSLPSFMDTPTLDVPTYSDSEFEALTAKERERILFNMLRQLMESQVDLQAKLAGYEAFIREMLKPENTKKMVSGFMDDMLGGLGGGMLKGLF